MNDYERERYWEDRNSAPQDKCHYECEECNYTDDCPDARNAVQRERLDSVGGCNRRIK